MPLTTWPVASVLYSPVFVWMFVKIQNKQSVNIYDNNELHSHFKKYDYKDIVDVVIYTYWEVEIIFAMCDRSLNFVLESMTTKLYPIIRTVYGF